MTDEKERELNIIISELNQKLDRLGIYKDELRKEISFIRSTCLAVVLEAHDKYNKACENNVIQHDRLVLALQYRDYLYLYSRMVKTDLVLPADVLRDSGILLSSHPG